MSPMASIRVLSDGLVNRIAAGEVVERPASVVKELVENSLDAGAGRVVVELAQGGRSLVRGADDGVGMDGDDALLALERHATSKLTADDDLSHIATLGFRGEALPSIAAVSRFELTTAADPARGGTRVTVDGGRILGVSGVARGRGTTVTVRDLFFNTPARRKFLHAAETELRHAQETVLAAAVARPEIAFTLSHGGRTLLEVAPAADLASRFFDLVGEREGGDVRRFELKRGELAVHGVLARASGSGRPRLTLVVNRRPVRDRLVVGAVYRVLRAAGPGFGGARVVVVVELPPEDVDVNVHPAKAEVRFANSGAVFAAVEQAVRTAVDAWRGGPVAPYRVETLADHGAPGVAEASAPSFAPSIPSGGTPQPLFPHPVFDLPWTRPQAGEASWHEAPPVAARGGPASGAPDTPLGRLIGQYRGTFILLEDATGLVIVDQHVAHERILYERFLRQLAGEAAPSQRLAFPHLLTASEALVAALPRVAALLERAGLEVEEFGPDTLRLTALPPELDEAAAERTVIALLERATALDGVPEQVVAQLAEGLAADLSCKAAVKANDHLGLEQQRALIADLARADNPWRCPHGRPIVLRLGHDEMERRLGRR